MNTMRASRCDQIAKPHAGTIATLAKSPGVDVGEIETY
jgi:hypothetical protein